MEWNIVLKYRNSIRDVQICPLSNPFQTSIIKPTYKECARDKLVDRTATCSSKVLKLDRWVRMRLDDGTCRKRWVPFLCFLHKKKPPEDAHSCEKKNVAGATALGA